MSRRAGRIGRLAAGLGLAALVAAPTQETATAGPAAAPAASPEAPIAADTAVAIFAGGCFWCMEPPFDQLEGVLSTTSGYIGGHVADPTYKQVSSGGTGHLEAVRVAYDPERVGYARLLRVFWRNVDPTDAGGQFCDRGEQYTTAIFYRDEEQRRLAEASRDSLERADALGAPIVTEIRKAGTFYAAEEYHQDYYEKNPIRYKFYRWNCGRDRRLEALWGRAEDPGPGRPPGHVALLPPYGFRTPPLYSTRTGA